jgi:prepilin-type N-terminal cleavage/methylation domain-containing protein
MSHPRKAFTLVELLVVIGIISVLVAILMPALSKARDAANTAVCLSNLRQGALAMIQYAGDNKDHLPHLSYHTSNGVLLYWMHPIHPYLLATRNITNVLPFGKAISGFGGTYMKCPANTEDLDTSDNAFNSTYGVNYGGPFQYYEPSWPAYGSVRLSKVRLTTYLMMDTRKAANVLNPSIGSAVFQYDSEGDGVLDSYYSPDAQLSWLNNAAHFPHRDQACMCFRDGHAETIRRLTWLKQNPADVNNVWGPRLALYSP